MIKELESDEVVTHYLSKAFQELQHNPQALLKATITYINQNTDSRLDQTVADQLLLPLTMTTEPSHKPPPSTTKHEPPPPSQQQQIEEEDTCSALLTPNSGNGADLPNYSWTQTLAEVTITIPLPPRTKGKACSINISTTKLHVSIPTTTPTNSNAKLVLLDGELYAAIKPDDSTWTISDGKTLEILLIKQDTMKMSWWKSIIKGDREIDTTQVEPENSQLSDLDPETRASVEKMMMEMQQKGHVAGGGVPMMATNEPHMSKEEALARFQQAHPELDLSQAKIT
jgi:hypothetical protein